MYLYYSGTADPRTLAQLQSNVTASKVDRLAAGMQERGYSGPPIETMPTMGPGSRLGVTDGTHRRRAAIRAGLRSVPVYGVTGAGVIPEGMQAISRDEYQALWETQRKGTE